VNLKDIKKQGLEQVAKQMGLCFDSDNMTRTNMIDFLDPNLRTIDKQYHLAIVNKSLAYSSTEIGTEDRLQSIKQCGLQQLRTHDIAEVFNQTEESSEEKSL